MFACGLLAIILSVVLLCFVLVIYCVLGLHLIVIVYVVFYCMIFTINIDDDVLASCL